MPHMSVLCVCADRARPQVSKAWEPRVRASFTSPMAMLATASMWWAMLCSQLGALAGLFPSARLDIVRAMTGFLVPLSQVRRHTRQTYTADIHGRHTRQRYQASSRFPGHLPHLRALASAALDARPYMPPMPVLSALLPASVTASRRSAARSSPARCCKRARGRLPAMRALSGCAHSPVSVCNRGAGAGRVLAAAGTSLHGPIRLVGGHQRRARGRRAVGGARAPAQQQRPRALCSCPGCAAGRAGSCCAHAWRACVKSCGLVCASIRIDPHACMHGVHA